jgi:hypothetical protein
MIRFNDNLLSISVLATLCRLVGSLTTNGKFRSDSYVSGWSCGPNKMSTSDYLILLPGSMR